MPNESSGALAGDLDVDLSDEQVFDSQYAEPPRERWAFLLTWALLALLLLTLVAFTFTFLILVHGRATGEAKALVTESLVPFMNALQSFCSTIFGPLLGVAVGFFVGQRRV